MNEPTQNLLVYLVITFIMVASAYYLLSEKIDSIPVQISKEWAFKSNE